jgi:hypothetical protein
VLLQRYNRAGGIRYNDQEWHMSVAYATGLRYAREKVKETLVITAFATYFVSFHLSQF